MVNDTNRTELLNTFRVEDFGHAQLTEEEMTELASELEDLGGDLAPDARRVHIPHGGTSFDIPAIDGEGTETASEILGAIVKAQKINTYWGIQADRDEESKGPVCVSSDTVYGFNSDTGCWCRCDTCPNNQYGSAVDEYGRPTKGKACKNSINLFILRDNEPEMILVSVPPSSISGVNEKLKACLRRGKQYSKALWSLRLKVEAKGGKKYSKIELSNLGQFSPEIQTKLAQARKDVAETLALAIKTPTEQELLESEKRREQLAAPQRAQLPPAQQIPQQMQQAAPQQYQPSPQQYQPSPQQYRAQPQQQYRQPYQMTPQQYQQAPPQQQIAAQQMPPPQGDSFFGNFQEVDQGLPF